MKSRALMLFAIGVFVVLSVSAVSAQNQQSKSQPPNYTVVDLGTPLGRSFATGTSINILGWVGGYAADANAQQIITFEAPNSGTSAYQGTAPMAINLFGTITGTITDSSYGTHGFVRTRDGQFTEFDVPGANPTAGCTCPVAINDRGVIAGYYIDTNSVGHGFLRAANGKFTKFNPPGAANQSGGTIVLGLNLEGATAGYYRDASSEAHGFVRSPDGEFTTFEAPGACTTGLNNGCHATGAWDINIVGTVVGAYEDTSGNFVAHTFIRSRDGTFTTFSFPGSSMEAGQGTLPAQTSGLNDSGAITGLYYDVNNTIHGYLRSPDGAFTSFDAPGADMTIPYNGTYPTSLNDIGAITGQSLDINEIFHGFVRSRAGEFETFDAPGADTNAGDYNGTFPIDMNLFGAVTGYYIDASSVYHGFVRTP
jgi:hypothetical protein